MKKILIAIALASCGVVAMPVLAQSAMTSPAMASPVKSDQLYQALGQKAGLQSLMDIFVAGLVADPRTAAHFKNANQKNLKTQLVDQFCMISGGPCAYKGADMKTAHEDMHISKSDFHALVEILQAAMDSRSIPFADQNKLLALLAPMHRDVIAEK